MMAIDPICGMQVDPEKAAARVEYEGTTYYFCCGHCAKTFSADPAKYAGQKAADMPAHGHHHGGGCCHH